jgi:hypothetical protein
LKLNIDNKVTKNLISELISLLNDQGAIFSDDMIIDSINGSLGISLESDVDDRVLIAVPGHTLITVDDVDLRLSGEDIVVEDTKWKSDDIRNKVLELIVDLYNSTKKINIHRNSFPSIVFGADQEILNLFLSGRSVSTGDELTFKISDVNKDDSVLNSFIKTRVLGCKTEVDKEQKTRVIMPIIDFLNHNHRAPAFSNSFTKEGELWMRVRKSKPLSGSNECFVRYGRYDSYDTLMHYGYAEYDVPFVRSVPLEFEIPDIGKLKIHAYSGLFKHQELPEKIKDLHAFLPDFVTSGDCIEASYLQIPVGGASPFALCRVLGVFFIEKDSLLNEESVKPYVKQAEEIVISKNIDFYKEAINKLDNYTGVLKNSSILDEYKKMCASQISLLQDYQSPL